MKITQDMTFESLERIPEIREAGPYLIGGDGQYYHMVKKLPLEEGTVLGWNAPSMIEGVEYLIKRAGEGKYLYRVYSQEEQEKEPEKAEVNVIHFPGKKQPKGRTPRPYVMLCPGGAYVNVCSISEGYPVAKRWNELGYDVFVVNYRVNKEKIMPHPLDDLAACIRYVREHGEQFGLEDPDCYAVGGFSAGGNLTALWGLKQLGYKKYGLPKPAAMFPIYSVTDLKLFDGLEEEAVAAFLRTLFGAGWTEEKKEEYSVLSHMDREYPPCFVACCKDDATVPYINSVKLYEKLQQLHIPAVLELGEHGGHGFGDGRFCDLQGWIDRAAAFIDGREK